MKIIDLLNKIANGEEIKKIRYDGTFYYFKDGDFKEVGNEYSGGWLFANETIDLRNLNDDIEIIEEEKKIPEKIEYYDDSIAWVIDDVGQLSDVDKVIIDALNQVIDYLKSKGE